MQPNRCAAIVAATVSTTIAASLAITPEAHAGVVLIDAARDNTIYDKGATSNGAGQYMFAGMTAAQRLRRCLVEFDIAGEIPAGSTITAVSLSLHMSRSISGNADVSLHRVLSDWGEGDSDAPNEEGAGAPAEDGDATWNFTFFPTLLWNNAGGDFAAASATTAVGSVANYLWSSPAMIADVQSFLDDPSEDFGWMLVGDEQTPASAKRFDTHENPNPAFRPVLLVSFEEASCDPKLGDADGDGCVSFADILEVLRHWDMTGKPGIPGDANCDGSVGILDITLVLGTYGQGSCP